MSRPNSKASISAQERRKSSTGVLSPRFVFHVHVPKWVHRPDYTPADLRPAESPQRRRINHRFPVARGPTCIPGKAPASAPHLTHRSQLRMRSAVAIVTRCWPCKSGCICVQFLCKMTGCPCKECRIARRGLCSRAWAVLWHARVCLATSRVATGSYGIDLSERHVRIVRHLSIPRQMSSVIAGRACQHTIVVPAAHLAFEMVEALRLGQIETEGHAIAGPIGPADSGAAPSPGR